MGKLGPLDDPVTWYKITPAGTKVAPSGTSKTKQSTFVLEVPLCNLRPSRCNFVPCNRIVQRAYLKAEIVTTARTCEVCQQCGTHPLVQHCTHGVGQLGCGKECTLILERKMAMIEVAHMRSITAQSIIDQMRLCAAAYELPGVVSQISLNRMKLNKDWYLRTIHCSKR